MTRFRTALSTATIAAALCVSGCSDANPPPVPPPARDLGPDATPDGAVLVDGEALFDGPPPPKDFGPDVDGTEAFDGSTLDDAAADDAGEPADGGPKDGAAESDAAIRDASLVDATFPDFGPTVSCLDDAGVYDACYCPTRAVACTGAGDPACPAGTTCLQTGCGNTFCLRAGAACVDDRDCTAGATCTSISSTESVCARGDGACVDSRDCPGLRLRGRHRRATVRQPAHRLQLHDRVPVRLQLPPGGRRGAVL